MHARRYNGQTIHADAGLGGADGFVLSVVQCAGQVSVNLDACGERNIAVRAAGADITVVLQGTADAEVTVIDDTIRFKMNGDGVRVLVANDSVVDDAGGVGDFAVEIQSRQGGVAAEGRGALIGGEGGRCRDDVGDGEGHCAVHGFAFPVGHGLSAGHGMVFLGW